MSNEIIITIIIITNIVMQHTMLVDYIIFEFIPASSSHLSRIVYNYIRVFVGETRATIFLLYERVYAGTIAFADEIEIVGFIGFSSSSAIEHNRTL